MSVRDLGFHPYDGVRTPLWSRFEVITRYALREALGKKKTLVFLFAAALPPLAAAIIIYLHHNTEALGIFGIDVRQILPIDGGFFLTVLRMQAIATFFLFLVVGASLVTLDLRDNALPLYLARPLSRREYVLGKGMVLGIVGSLATWVPGLALFALQASLEGPRWLLDHWRWPVGYVLGSWAIIVLLGLICLAVSASTSSKAAAEGIFVALFIALPATAEVIEAVLREATWPQLLQLQAVIERLLRSLFGLPGDGLPTVTIAMISFLLFCGLSLVQLARRVRAYEVVRS